MADTTNSNKRIIDLAIKDLRQISRERRTFLFLLVMPIIFTLLFGFAFGGSSTDDPRLPIGLLDQDQSERSQELASILDKSQVLRITDRDSSSAALEKQVADEDLAAAVIIPTGFQEAILEGNPQAVTIIGGGQTGFTIQGEVNSIIARMLSAVQAAEISVQTAEQQNLISSDEAAMTHFDNAYQRVMAEWQSPPVTIHQDQSSALAEEAAQENSNYNVYAHSSPGMMAQFAIAGLMGAAGILVVEKKTRSLQRLITTNMSKGQILIGHFLAMFIMILLQIIILILFGQIFLDLPYLGQPLATLAMTFVTALFAAGLGLLIGVVSKTDEQVIILSLVPMFLLSALGGAWVPLEVTPQTFQRIAYLTPIAWVMDGYKDIIVRGQGLEAVDTAVFILIAYAVILFAIASWRFRLD